MFGRDRHDTYRDLIVIMLCIPGAQVVIRSIHGGRIAGTDTRNLPVSTARICRHTARCWLLLIVGNRVVAL